MPAMPPQQKVERLRGHVRKLGCPDPIWLDAEPTPAHMEYLDLLPHKSGPLLMPDAVAEFQGRPLLYLVDGINETGAPRLQARQIADLQQMLANRSEHACLGVVTPGSLDVYPINLDRKELEEARFKTILISEPEAGSFFQSLATGTYDLPGRPQQADYVFTKIHNLLKAASEDLAGRKGKSGEMRGLDVLSTTGRALFFRFLIDRGIVLPAELSQISAHAEDMRDVFSNAAKAAATSCWLDETFNGDLLPLVEGLTSETDPKGRLLAYQRFYQEAGAATNQRIFGHLSAILRGCKHVGGSLFQMSFDVDWDDFNFAHIPIGVLSQVYESFSHQWDESHAEQTSVYYTPRGLARLLVEGAFAGSENPVDAMVLDPACGAGVFLVLAFRQLVREYWAKNGTRPDTKGIQRILYKQLRGFEVSESALRLSALSLYISAIEVNNTQRPPKALRFPRPLRDEVLFSFQQKQRNPKGGFVLGSLGPEVPVSFNNSFDIVVTNPPWTRLRATSSDKKEKAEEKRRIDHINTVFTDIGRRALVSRGLDNLARSYRNPDYDPDLPFLWRATEWAKAGGIIAMALPGRLILKQGGAGKAARDAILEGLAVTGILNGSDLEKTPVWPNMDLPFLLLFARNSSPKTDHHFHFVTPVRENQLSRRGLFRLDYKSAETVSAKAVIEKPWLLKTLAVGTVLDVQVIDRLPQGSVAEFWKKHKLKSGQGYNNSPDLEQRPATDLLDLPDFEAADGAFSIPPKLPTWRERYQRETAHFPRQPALYKAPLVIVPRAPGESVREPKAFISLRRAIAFSQSNYGFSAANADQGAVIASALYLAVHSSLYQYFCLMRSSSQGASYRIFLKEDLEAFPFPDPRALPEAQRRRVLELAKALEVDTRKPWTEIDNFIFSLYGLDEDDAGVVRDTVAFCGPYQSVRDRAEEPVPSVELKTFCRYLEDMLQPLFGVANQTVVVRPQQQDTSEWSPSWRFVSVTMQGVEFPKMQELLARLMMEANKTGASRVTLRVPGGGLVVGILNQRRFWTSSRARLCSLHIERHHMSAFPMPTS
jgi:N-6 DNA Methylase